MCCCINRFPTDTENEIKVIIDELKKINVNVILSEVWAKGGEGAIELANEVVRLCETDNDFTFAYEDEDSIETKIEKIVKKVYGGAGVDYTADAKKQLRTFKKLGYNRMPVCMAKTQYSLSDNAKLLGAPENFKVTVRNLKISAGAGFIVALTGEIMTMPGLPKVPAAENIDVDDNGVIKGLF